MKTGGFALAAIGFALFLVAEIVAADTATFRALNAIIESDESLEEEAALAMALVNMEHKVKTADAERLADIAEDDFYDESVRKLASILLNINHSPSDEDKVVLAALLE
jgi:hypothetical protein